MHLPRGAATPAPSANATYDPALVAKGAWLAAIGNCNTCHTASNGRTFAGGRPLSTPFGTIYATNITPDPETGIGRWSPSEFLRAMHEGVDREGVISIRRFRTTTSRMSPTTTSTPSTPSS